MAEAARAGSTPLHRGLPDEIAIWEILLRLPPKALLRCRAVCRAWRSATSTRDFLLAHHARQPTLPVLYGFECGGNDGGPLDITPFGSQTGVAAADDQLQSHSPAQLDDAELLNIIPFNHQAGVAAADQLQSVAQLDNVIFELIASCDGLLVLSVYNNFSICNPVTREYAPLHQIHDLVVLGMYTHSPTGEYRLLLYDDGLHDAPYGSYVVFTVGSDQPPRHVGYLEAGEMTFFPLLSIMFRGNLHWHERANNMVRVFDTTAESFRQMPVPAARGCQLFEMGDMLGMSSFSNNAATVVDIWVMQDYESEVWAFKYRVELPLAEIKVQFTDFDNHRKVVVAFWDGDVRMLVESGDWLLHVDVKGKLVASFHHGDLSLTRLGLKQTLVAHTFFPAMEGYAVNASPFM